MNDIISTAWLQEWLKASACLRVQLPHGLWSDSKSSIENFEEE
jgi:AMMECR1 domain-containing protein